MKKIIRVIGIIMAMCLILGFALTGCSQSLDSNKDDQGDTAKDGQNNTTGQTTADKEADSSDEPVTIRILTRYSGTDATTPILEGIIEEFEDTYPNITVQNDSINEEAAYNNKIKTDFATGNPPNMFYLPGVVSNVEYAKNGLLMDVTPLMEDDEFYSGFIPGMFETWNFEEYGVPGYYGIPFSIGIENFYYNKELFEQAGIDKVPETMDDLYEVIDKLKEHDIIPWGVGAKETWRAGHIHNFLLYKSLGVEKAKQLGSRQAKWTDPDVVETLDLLKDLKARGAFEENFEGIDYDTEKANFFSGKSAMVLNGSWFVGDVIQSDIADKIGVFPFPYFKEKPEYQYDTSIFPQGQHLSGKMNDAEKEATIKFVKLMFGQKWQNKMVVEIERLSARQDLSFEGAELSDVFKEIQSIVGTVRNPGGDSFDFDPLPSMQDRTRNSIIGMLLGNSAQEAAQEIQDEIDKSSK